MQNNIETTKMRSFTDFVARQDFNYEPFEAIYKHIHSYPELSHQEESTSKLVLKTLRTIALDLDIHTHIGGHGIVAALKNGPGPTIMLRADMDALPVTEQTGLAYSSKTTSVMHACGHDMHTTALLAASSMLINGRSSWSGTLLLLFQPAEEAGDGAKLMLADGLFDKIPKPDVILGQHVAPLPAGTISVKPGTVMAASDNFTITIHGHGGHGSMPHLCVDALVIACNIVIRLQSIVSREMPPDEAVVLTVGELHAGTAENIISNKAVMKLNMRTVSSEWRQCAIDSVKRIVRTECEGRCTQEPTIEHTSSLPITSNNDSVAEKLAENFKQHFGNYFLKSIPSTSASEDFNEFANALQRPSCFWFWGGIVGDPMQDPAKPNINHSPYFAPLCQPTLTTGTHALVIAALSYLLPSEP